jgi:hypothetical protein
MVVPQDGGLVLLQCAMSLGILAVAAVAADAAVPWTSLALAHKSIAWDVEGKTFGTPQVLLTFGVVVAPWRGVVLWVLLLLSV